MSVAPPGGQDRIMMYGPKSDGTYIIEFRMADGEGPAQPPMLAVKQLGFPPSDMITKFRPST